ncbi:hypothetical protein KO317_02200 [Candidatus Micrarchaeota archaeon]|nr:hypothetical protein [Candidatus Micrarchaeota archaeon]
MVERELIYKPLYAGSFVPKIEDITKLITLFGREFCKEEAEIDRLEVKELFLINESIVKINRLKEFLNIKPTDILKFEIFLDEFFEKLKTKDSEFIEEGIYTLNETEEIVELNINLVLIKFLENSNKEDFLERKAEVLYLIEPLQKQGIELFSKFLNDFNTELSFTANNIFKTKIQENEKEIMIKIYSYLNNNTLPDDAHIFYKFIREDPKIYRHLHIDKPAGLRILLDLISDRNEEISKKAKDELEKVMYIPHFKLTIAEYINEYARPNDIDVLYLKFIDHENALLNISTESFRGLKVLLTAFLDSRKEVRDTSKKVLDKYMLSKMNREILIDYLNSDYVCEADIYSVIHLFNQNKVILNRRTLSKMSSVPLRFPSTNIAIKSFIECYYDEI